MTRRSEDDFNQEIRAHLELEAADLIAEGVPKDRAHAAARREFGSVASTRQRLYEKSRVVWLDDLARDVRHSVALYRRAPGFTIAVIVTLALGIGLNTAIFSLVNALLLRPLPVPDSARLIAVHTSDFSGPARGSTGYPDYIDFRDSARDVFTGLAAYSMELMNLSDGTVSDRVQGHVVTQNYFAVVGIDVERGRVFAPSDVDVVVVSHGLWQRLLGGREDVLGRSLMINGRPSVVIGVARQGFTGLLRGLPADLWLPIERQPQHAARLTERGSRWLSVVGRLAEGVELPRAQAAFKVVGDQLHRAYPREWTDLKSQGRRITLERADDVMLFIDRADILPFMATLMAVVGIVLLLACLNVSNLMLARAAVRGREMAIRLSVGAGRARVVRQLFTESMLLAIVAGLASTMVAYAATTLLVGMQPPLPLRIALDLSPDARVMGFTAFVSMLTALLFGLLPALRMTRPDLASALKAGRPDAAGHGMRLASLRNGLVVVQVALSVVLVIGAGLSVLSLRKAGSVGVGFEPRNVVIASVNAGLQGYDNGRARSFFDQLTTRIGALRGVRSAALAEIVPLGFTGQRTRVELQAYAPRNGEDMEINFNVVGLRYFETMRIPLVQGREFDATDRLGSQGAVIVNEALVRRYWSDGVAIGKQIRRGRTAYTVVGVTADGKYRSLSESPLPYFYLALGQNPESNLILHVRTDREPVAVASAIRATVRELDRDLPLTDVRTLEDHLGLVLMPLHAAATLLGAFGALALGLAVVGIYSVMAYTVSQQTREIGIRMALGARLGDVLSLVLREGLIVVAIGLLGGTLAAAAVTRFAASLFHGVSPTDPMTFAGALGMLGAAGLVAALLPALRAARIRPSVALRQG
jgi:macrolide transport system ATP-binding/permease protein